MTETASTAWEFRQHTLPHQVLLLARKEEKLQTVQRKFHEADISKYEPWNSVLIDKLTVIQLILRLVRNAEVHFSAYNGLHLVLILSQ
jgi:hypothetical protein